ncbi:MAG: hypothetical protein ACREHG_02310, partial [Candidatus Saccharimonadales bacterium]
MEASHFLKDAAAIGVSAGLRFNATNNAGVFHGSAHLKPVVEAIHRLYDCFSLKEHTALLHCSISRSTFYDLTGYWSVTFMMSSMEGNVVKALGLGTAST